MAVIGGELLLFQGLNKKLQYVGYFYPGLVFLIVSCWGLW
jgi:hypothetical protein